MVYAAIVFRMWKKMFMAGYGSECKMANIIFVPEQNYMNLTYRKKSIKDICEKKLTRHRKRQDATNNFRQK